MIASAPPAPHVARPRLPVLCVPVAEGSPDALFARSAALLGEFPFQELRLDYLPDPAAALLPLQAHKAAHPGAIFLATCRRIESGGHFVGTVEGERAILSGAAAAGCALVDLALESAEILGPQALDPLRAAGATVILSWHDFERTGDLAAVLARMRPFAPDFAKLVPTANSLADNLPLLRQLEDPAGLSMGLIGMSMGEPGLLSRVLGPRTGSAFTFGPGTAAGSTAPGQIPAPVLRDLYRVGELDKETRVFGVAGSPIHSSLSPLMLNTAFHETDVNAVYLPLLTGDAADLIKLARALPLAGFSVTMPLKQSIVGLLDRVDPLAARIGAVNTVRREPDGSLSGFNTDAAGITSPLANRVPLRGARVLVLGAGGAARAAVFACADAGAEVSVLNRTLASAVALAREAGARAVQAEQLTTEPVFDVLINATPAGMRQNAAELPLPAGSIPARLVFDLVYNPLDTPLLQRARQQGLEVIPGVEMFIHQGARQFELWTGSPAPVEAMRRVVLDALA